MVWSTLSFVNVGQEVTDTFVNELLSNLDEDDVAKVDGRGGIVVATGASVGQVLELPSPNTDRVLLRSNMNESKRMEWSDSVLSGNFVTFGELKMELDL